MSEDSRKVDAFYGGKLRVRVCGLLRRPDGALLCALHRGVGPVGHLWIPPGGGLAYGEAIADCLSREFKEETGLDVTPGPLYDVSELLHLPLHAVELFYQVESHGHQQLHQGSDPEAGAPAILERLAWIKWENVKDWSEYHTIVRQVLESARNLADAP